MIEELQGTKAEVSIGKVRHATVSAKKKVGFFQEENGSNSSMRLMCFLALIAATMFGVLTIHLNSNGNSDGGNGLYITFGFLIAAFAPKAVQKFAEQKLPKNDE